MKHTLLFILLSAIYFSASPGPLSFFVSPAPERKQDSAYVIIQLNMPAGILGIVKSSTPGRQVDPVLLNCVGIGPSYQRQVWTGRNYTTFAATLAVLFFPRLDAGTDVFPWDVGAGAMVTILNGYGFGIAYNGGSVEGKTINRLIGLLIYEFNAPWKNK